MSSYGLWLSAAGMKVMDHRQAVLANNLANANTTGFKHDLAIVTQRRIESQSRLSGSLFAHPVLDGMAGGLDVRPTFHNFAQGPIERSGKPLDVAIEGEGFLAVSDGNVTRYTRNGELAMNTDRELVLAAGDGRWRVLDDGGERIVFDDDGGTISVSDDGTIRQDRAVVATLGLMTTEDKQSLRKVGENLFDAGEAEMSPINGVFRPESREASNFSVISGLATIMEVARAYQLNAKLIQLQDKMTGQLITTLGRPT